MRLISRQRLWFALASCMAIAGLAGVVAAQPAKGPQKWPPQFPREGATKIFENDQVIVWEQIGRPKTPFVHKHLRDILTFQVEPGTIEVLGPDLQKIVSSTGTGATQRLTPANRGGLSFTKAGLGPHAEVEAATAKPSRSIFVEIKGTEPKDCAQWSTAC
ncbi:MAG: hypothetical protein FJW27_01885 [Acidimicrobiia bacterium]|nr:hypothetical protein [Acidimicrobiia bacterium]